MIKQGAIIMGKIKTVEFAGEQEVVADWVDYSYPFNLRGDYYLGEQEVYWQCSCDCDLSVARYYSGN
jgi:hypothetical protein